MKNYLKPVLFYCSSPKYGVLEGKVRYWHIVKRQCYPKGCVNNKGIHFAPKLLVSTEEFKHYEQEYHHFRKWADGLKHKRRVSLMGVVHQIFPYLEVALVGDTLLTILRGHVMVYKECVIDDTFYEDKAYVVMNREWLNQLQLRAEDTVSASGRFDMDERGIVSIGPAEEVKRVFAAPAYKPWQPDLMPQLTPFSVDYLLQDRCMACEHSLFATKWRQSKKIHINWLCCLAGEYCKLGREWK